MGGLSIWHWLIVLLIVALVFGTKRLRDVGRDLGGAIKDFKEGMRSEPSDANRNAPGQSKPPVAPPAFIEQAPAPKQEEPGRRDGR